MTSLSTACNTVKFEPRLMINSSFWDKVELVALKWEITFILDHLRKSFQSNWRKKSKMKWNSRSFLQITKKRWWNL